MVQLYLLAALFAIVTRSVAADIPLVFTSTPLAVVIGQVYNLTWIGGDGLSPVTIQLRRGDAANLIWVADLTTDATDGSYVWTVPSDLPDGTDYAFELFEMSNISNVNYSARFSLRGSSSSQIATITINQPAGTEVGTGISMGTGSALPRNTTFVAPTLTAAVTCSGLTGICAGSAASTTSVEPSYASPLASSSPRATTNTNTAATYGCLVGGRSVTVAGLILILVWK